MRIHELAKELSVPSKQLVAALSEMGYAGLTASSSVPGEAVPRLRASGGAATAKPKAAEVEQVPRVRPVRKAPEPAPQPTRAAGDGNGAGAAVTARPAQAPTIEAEPVPAAPPTTGALPLLRVGRGVTPQELAEKTDSSVAQIVKLLLSVGEMVTATQSLSDDAVQLIAHELGYEAEIVDPSLIDVSVEEDEEEVDETRLRPRPPVVTVMGHVDHGKSSILDAIRKTDVVGGEFGGITQHIGAYQIRHDGHVITFIDTPGHEAFTAMRARGAQVTDIAVLVVAADDGVKPQTIEAINHARAAKVPILVAVNKVDKEEADPQRVRQQLTEHDLVAEEWGGDTVFVDVSAKTGQNLDQLLGMIQLLADVQELKADPDSHARGTVVEAHLDKGRGPSATVLVLRGTLHVGDAIISGTSFGRVRAMLDEHGATVDAAGPAKPVQVLGLATVPNAGDEFRVVEDDREARHLSHEREARHRAAELVGPKRTTSLRDLLKQTREGEVPELNLIVKADVQGSVEALTAALEKLSGDEVRVRILHEAAGGIGENDVSLALASDAIIVGFNVRPSPDARDLAEKEKVDIRLYNVIYQVVDDVRKALLGMLAPLEEVVELGRAEVRATFRVPKIGFVAGCYVTEGQILRNSQARLVRDGVIVYTGRIGSLRRFKDDVREVAAGFECGIGLENFADVKEGDVIEAFEVREVART